jgi:WD40 repeat protein
MMRVLETIENVDGILFDPLGRFLVVTSGRSRIGLLDLRGDDQPPIEWLDLNSSRFHMACLSPDGSRLMCAAGHGGLLVYDLSGSKPQRIFHDETYGLSCTSRADGLVCGVTSDNTGSALRFWNWSDISKPLIHLEHDVGRWYANPVFLPDGVHYACVERRDAENDTSTTRDWLALRVQATNELLAEVKIGDYVSAPLVWCEVSQCLFTAQKSRLRFWNPFDETEKSHARRVQNSKTLIDGLAIHPQRPLLMLANNKHHVKVLDTTTRKVVHQLRWKIGRIRAVEFSSDGLVAAAFGHHGKIILWDFEA